LEGVVAAHADDPIALERRERTVELPCRHVPAGTIDRVTESSRVGPEEGGQLLDRHGAQFDVHQLPPGNTSGGSAGSGAGPSSWLSNPSFPVADPIAIANAATPTPKLPPSSAPRKVTTAAPNNAPESITSSRANERNDGAARLPISAPVTANTATRPRTSLSS